jgi:hypothetical protein
LHDGVDNNNLFAHDAAGTAKWCFLLFSFLTPHCGHEKKADHHLAAMNDLSRIELRHRKISFSRMKPQQFDHDDGQMMPPLPQQQSTKSHTLVVFIFD